MPGYVFRLGASVYEAEERLVAWNRSDRNRNQSWNLSLVGDWDRITENSSTQNQTHRDALELLSADSPSLQHDVKENP